MSSGVKQARRLIEHGDGHPVISLYLDLDPERFATAPARSSQIRSLIDQARREIEADQERSHEDRQKLREALQRIDSFLHSDQAPYKGARALAVFCSTPDGLFETIALTRPATGRVVIAGSPYVEPMVAAIQQRHWLVGLVNRRQAHLLAGTPDRLQERERLRDNVHGQHDQGGWSQARYERSVDKDVEDHLRQFADIIERRWRAERFDRLALGGPREIVPRLRDLLAEDVLAHLAPERVDIDLSSATEASIAGAIEELVTEDDRRSEREALDRMADGAAGGGRATRGLQETLQALNERRVERLLVDPGFEGRGQRCPSCEMLLGKGEGEGEDEAGCPADGSALEEVEDLREAVVEAALVQDAGVTVIEHHDDLQQAGIGALLRF